MAAFEVAVSERRCDGLSDAAETGLLLATAFTVMSWQAEQKLPLRAVANTAANTTYQELKVDCFMVGSTVTFAFMAAECGQLDIAYT